MQHDNRAEERRSRLRLRFGDGNGRESIGVGGGGSRDGEAESSVEGKTSVAGAWHTPRAQHVTTRSWHPCVVHTNNAPLFYLQTIIKKRSPEAYKCGFFRFILHVLGIDTSTGFNVLRPTSISLTMYLKILGS